MKIKNLSFLLIISLISFSSFAQTENDEPLLGLPGDNLDLYAVLDLFQKSKTIEDFEKSLNEESTGINNLDLDNDEKIDFIKVVTEKDGDDFLFILQDPISEKETQDVAVISVSKDEAGKVFMQIIGDEALYGKDYVVEPATTTSPGVTANPAYVGDDPVTVNVAATTEVIVVESTPIVKYVYSPVYVPYHPPYYYGYYPPYWRPIAVISIGIYRHNNWYHHHGGYHGGRGGSVHIHNNVNINNYNNNKRNTSNKVNNNINKGNFDTAGKGGTRPSTSQAGRGNGASASNRASTKPSTSQGRTKGGASTSNRASTSNNKASSANRASTSNKASTSPSSRPSTSQANRSSSPSASNRSSSASNRSSSASNRSSPSRSSGASRSGASRGGGGRRR